MHAIARKVDATQGPLMKNIFIYTLPLIVTTLVQQLFSLVDTAVLGNMADTNSVAAVGATTAIINLIVNTFIGLSNGTTIVLARYIGQRNREKTHATVDTALLTALGVGILVAVFGFFTAPVFLRMTDCPESCFAGAVLYIRIYIASAPAILLYNYGAAILRTAGDTQRPLVYMLIGGITNVILNVFLCLVLSQKVAAVAIATVASQVIGAVLVFRRLCHTDDDTRVTVSALRFHWDAFVQIVRFGIPRAISRLVVPVANLQIQTAVNSFGEDAIAGNSAATLIWHLVTAVSDSFGTATMTFMGQNIGVENKGRVRKSFWYCWAMGVLTSSLFGLGLLATGKLWLSLVLGGDATEAIAFGMTKLMLLLSFQCLIGSTHVLLSAVQSYGYPFLATLSTLLFTLVFRVIWMQWVFPLKPTFFTVMLCFPVSWLFNFLFFVTIVFILSRRYQRGVYRKI